MKNVKIWLSTIFCGLVLLTACSSDSGVSIDPAQQKATVDSLIQVKSESVKDSINRACEERIAKGALVKAKALVKEEAEVK